MKDDYPSDGAYRVAALVLACEEAAIRAVATVEAGRHGAFLNTGEPVILYEPHLFHRFTRGRFDSTRIAAPDVEKRYSWLSYPEWRPGHYGPLAFQHRKLQAATLLDRDAALRSCSWGLFQIVGNNYEESGYASLQIFINAMYRSADDHLDAFTGYILSSQALHVALQDRDWTKFARIYNGPSHEKHDYDGRIAAAYAKITGQLEA